jgi:hypothetical protein
VTISCSIGGDQIYRFDLSCCRQSIPKVHYLMHRMEWDTCDCAACPAWSVVYVVSVYLSIRVPPVVTTNHRNSSSRATGGKYWVLTICSNINGTSRYLIPHARYLDAARDATAAPTGGPPPETRTEESEETDQTPSFHNPLFCTRFKTRTNAQFFVYPVYQQIMKTTGMHYYCRIQHDTASG